MHHKSLAALSAQMSCTSGHVQTVFTPHFSQLVPGGGGDAHEVLPKG